jgi:hypothetical protein
MGIKDFHKWLKQEYPTAFKSKWLDSYNHVFIDLNYSLHSCTYNIKNIHQTYDRLYNFLNLIFKFIIPTKSITFASDGSAPISKLLLQRKRRLTMSLNTNLLPLHFTPSTKFMSTLQEKISPYCTFLKNIFNVDINLDIDGYDEAELKIERRMLNLSHESCLVLSNDGDVIVMLMMMTNYENIYICSGKDEIISLGELLLQHVKKVGYSKNPNLDFSAINIFLGNDYLPKINYVNIQKLWTAYRLALIQDHDGFILDDGLTINKNFFRKFLNSIISQTLKCYIDKITVTNINKDLYSNYFDGYTWCLHTYKTGICTRYNYMYNYTSTPHPFGMLIMINELKFSPITSDHINKFLYGILILPKSAKFLINSKYHKFIDENDILYDVELCKKCNSFHKNMSIIQDKIRKNKNDIESKCKYTELAKSLKLHKIIHEQLTLKDIEELIIKFNKIK